MEINVEEPDTKLSVSPWAYIIPSISLALGTASLVGRIKGIFGEIADK